MSEILNTANLFWGVITTLGTLLLGSNIYLLKIIVKNIEEKSTESKNKENRIDKTLIEISKKIDEKVQELGVCLIKNETSFEEFRAVYENNEISHQKEIKEMSNTMKHMDANVKVYGESIARLNTVVMGLEDEQKEQKKEIKEIWGIVHELKAKIA